MIWNALEDLRRRENAKRGYVEVKTPLLYDVETWKTSGHWEKFRDDMFLVPYGEERTLGSKPMNCPGHMLLFGDALRSYRELPLRYAEASTLHRNERAGTLHGLLRVQHVTQDDAHIFVTPEQIEEEIFGALDFASYLYDLFGMEARFELSTRPENKLGTDEEWDFTEAPSGRARAARHRIRPQRGRRRLLRAEDRPAHDRRAGPLVADGHDPARLADAGALRSHVRGRRQHGAHAVRDPPCAVRLARTLHRHPHRALRGRVRCGSRPSRYASFLSARTIARLRRCSPASSASFASKSTTRTRRLASESVTPRSKNPVRRRLGRQGVRGSPPCGSVVASNRPGHSTSFWRSSETLLRCEPASRAKLFLTSGAESSSEVQPSEVGEKRAAALTAVLVV